MRLIIIYKNQYCANFKSISFHIIDKLYSITDKDVIKSWIISCASAHI